MDKVVVVTGNAGSATNIAELIEGLGEEILIIGRRNGKRNDIAAFKKIMDSSALIASSVDHGHEPTKEPEWAGKDIHNTSGKWRKGSKSNINTSATKFNKERKKQRSAKKKARKRSK